MADYSLVPVDHQPDFDGVSLVPVEHDPFDAGGVMQPAQPPPSVIGQANVGAPASNAPTLEEGESWNPDTENGDNTGPSPPKAATSVAGNVPFKPFGELKPASFTTMQKIGHLAADRAVALGMQPYVANDLTKRIGNVLGLVPPLGVAGSAVDLVDAADRGDIPGAIAAAPGLIPGVRGVARGVAEEAGAALRRAVPIKDLQLLHPPETIGSRPELAGLSDEELLESVINPRRNDPVRVDTDSGKLADGNSRVFELQKRASDPASSITPDTRIPVVPYTKDHSMFDVP